MAMVDLAIGLVLAFVGWLLPRAVAGAWRWRPLSALAIDLTAPAICFVILLSATGRPIFAGIVVLATFGGFAFADWTKRAVLREPIVFSDMSEAVELVRHPQLYLPFAGTGGLILGVVGVLAAGAGLLWLEPRGSMQSPGLAAAVLLLAVAASLGVAGPLLQPTAARLRRLRASGDLVRDAAALGPLAIQ